MDDQKEKYRLRYAAGLYWLLDVEQKGQEYRKPISMNECGALICQRAMEGHTEEELAKELVKQYGIEDAKAKKDVAEFLEQLRAQGAIPGGH